MMIASENFQQMSFKDEREDQFEVEWLVPSSLPYLQGHFPGQPVLPAVGIVDASFYALQQRFPKCSLSGIETAKFLNLVQPGFLVRLLFKKLRDDLWLVDWNEASVGKHLATLQLRLEFGAP